MDEVYLFQDYKYDEDGNCVFKPRFECKWDKENEEWYFEHRNGKVRYTIQNIVDMVSSNLLDYQKNWLYYLRKASKKELFGNIFVRIWTINLMLEASNDVHRKVYALHLEENGCTPGNVKGKVSKVGDKRADKEVEKFFENVSKGNLL